MATWVRITVGKFERIRDALALKGVRQEMADPFPPYHAAWRLKFGGETVAFWYAGPMGNRVEARIS